MDQPMSQEELLEALAEQTRESAKFWKASQEFVPPVIERVGIMFRDLHPSSARGM
jgi:hypothetical protein